MRRKGLVTLVLTAGLALAGIFSSFAGEYDDWKNDKVGWIKTDEGWKWFIDENTYLTNAWKQVGANWNYLGADGNLMYDSLINDNGRTYYVDEDSNMLELTWKEKDGKKYYFGYGGSMLKNQWYRDKEGKWYYLGTDGAMLTNTTTPDGYTVNENGCWTVDGVVVVGYGEEMFQNQWYRNVDGKWYYLGEGGAMLFNTTTPDGYTVDELGRWTVDGVVQIQ